MKTIIGPFHPDLEEALVDEMLLRKSGDPLAPLLILVPSDLIRRRLKILFSREQRLALLNVAILTFFQLSRRLNDEGGAPDAEPRDDLFLEEALRRIIRTRQPGAEPYAGIENRAGGCAALWQTLRDLRDGMVDPAVALDALREGHFRERAGHRLAELLNLFQTFQDFRQAKHLTAQADLDRRATEQVATSSFLADFIQVYYYGFYDLTQIQLDLFHTVARHFPTTLLFPLLNVQPSHAAWSFAAQFYERYVQGRSDESPQTHEPRPLLASLFDEAADRSYTDLPKHWQCMITSAFGLHDEITFAAKEILKLNEQGETPFHEIGVVARGLEPYGATLANVFQQHCIPVAGRFERPLVEDPLAKTVNLLLGLPAKEFLRSQVIDFLSSPHVQFQTILRRTIKPRPDLWDLATRELAICKGIADWRRLRRYSRGGLRLSQPSEDDEPRHWQIPAAQLTALADLVDALVADLSLLPSQGSWRVMAAAWQTLLGKYLGITDDRTAPTGDGSPRAKILEILQQLGALDAIDDRVSLADFSHTFSHWIERSTITEDRRNRDGVMVLSATAARGLAFRALFILGMNESVFPRTIREDAFLRDSDRDVIERDLGYKVNAKLTAFDEEKLLFTLLVGAARERLYCSYQRADESGRVLSPSWYLGELQRALGTGARTVSVVELPRSHVEKIALAPFDRREFLLPNELGVRMTLQGEDPTALIEATTPLAEIYRSGRDAIAKLDHSGASLLAWDGMLANAEPHWKRISLRGTAPTTLETYARCPFQFFARHVLRLKPLDWPEESLGPSPAEFGQLGHTILDGFYQELIQRGYFTGNAGRIDTDVCLQAAAERAFTDYENQNPVGYPLFWEHLKDSLRQTLRQVITQDLAELAQSGFQPISLETQVAAHLPEEWPAPLNNLIVHGRMDRVDLLAGTDQPELRVIDYKFKFGGSPKTEDNNLALGALRGVRLQPPIYLQLAQQWAREHELPANLAIKADFYYVAPNWDGGPLTTKAYGSKELSDKVGAATKETIAYLAEGVRQGRFFINRGDACSLCDMARVCRKNHPPSVWRAENDPITKTHRELRKKTLKQL
ncbi:MAG: hypothetical protein FJ145_24240 [Deltaproteobacteria bacterium]|nr:hypothetical protein [Deltaproteobacteria bacterium]